MIDFTLFWMKAVFVQMAYIIVMKWSLFAKIGGAKFVLRDCSLRIVHYLTNRMGLKVPSNWMFTKKDELVIRQINQDASCEPKSLHEILRWSFFTDCAFLYDLNKKQVSLCVEKGLTREKQNKKIAELHCLFYLLDFLTSESYVVLIPFKTDDCLDQNFIIWKRTIDECREGQLIKELASMNQIILNDSFIPKFSFLLKNAIYATPKLRALVKNKYRTVEEIRFLWNFRVGLLAAVAAIVGAILAA